MLQVTLRVAPWTARCQVCRSQPLLDSPLWHIVSIFLLFHHPKLNSCSTIPIWWWEAYCNNLSLINFHPGCCLLNWYSFLFGKHTVTCIPFFKSKMSGKISLSPLENYELSISLSLLKIGEQHLKFLFLFSKMEKLFSLSLSLLEAWE